MSVVRERWVLHGAAAVVVVAVLAPLAAPGYVLAYDMVFVPRQPLRWDLIAPADALPRAVPLDALVALVTQAVPGWLVQRLALAAILYAAAVGAGKLVPAERTLTRVVAAIGYAWTPFLAERLLIGHWGLLLCYAALPWLIRAALARRTDTLVLAAAAAALTPTGGVIAFATACALPVPKRAKLAVGALNAPWLMAAVVTTASGRSDPAGVAAFAARGENWSGPLGALLGTGGIWNAQTTPASRASALVPLATAVVLALAVAGYPVLRRRWPAGFATRLAVVALVAFVLALAGTRPAAPLLEWLVAQVPGTGLLRDGQKLLIPYAMLLALCAALGAERLNRRAVLVGAALLPLVVLPDLAYGGAGRLRPVEYPRDWAIVADRIGEAPGVVLSLPFHTYRAYPWNGRRTALDPAPRYLPAPVLVDDTLVVGGTAVAGESGPAGEARQRLAAGAPVPGVRWVLVQRDAGGAVPDGALTGLHLVYAGPSLTLYENPDPGPPALPSPPWPLPLAGHALFGLLAAAAAVSMIRACHT
ncbi:hypothetical protein WEI85_02835 [Actinomycetes bacterium KLBMP 9797]